MNASESVLAREPVDVDTATIGGLALVCTPFVVVLLLFGCCYLRRYDNGAATAGDANAFGGAGAANARVLARGLRLIRRQSEKPTAGMTADAIASLGTIRIPHEAAAPDPPAGSSQSGGQHWQGNSCAGDMCSVCIAKFRPGEEARRLGCGPQFHRHCIDDWLRLQAVCPLCKAVVAAAAAVEPDGAATAVDIANGEIDGEDGEPASGEADVTAAAADADCGRPRP
eukprot:SAG22_NODE_2344_length_2686_cov_1.543873_2_plen_226_part_00